MYPPSAQNPEFSERSLLGQMAAIDANIRGRTASYNPASISVKRDNEALIRFLSEEVSALLLLVPEASRLAKLGRWKAAEMLGGMLRDLQSATQVYVSAYRKILEEEAKRLGYWTQVNKENYEYWDKWDKEFARRIDAIWPGPNANATPPVAHSLRHLWQQFSVIHSAPVFCPTIIKALQS